MNVLKREQIQRWRAILLDCWIRAYEDAELASVYFSQQKPPQMPGHVWGVRVSEANRLLGFWINHPPQVVIDEHEAKFLELESD